MRDYESGDTHRLTGYARNNPEKGPQNYSATTTLRAQSRDLSLSAGDPLIISSQPITTSDHTGPVIGYLVMGRFLDGKFVRDA